MEKILVIDDEEGLVNIITEILIEEGYDVTGTTDPAEGIKLINENHFDLVITDLKMPKVSGLEITNSAKKKSKDTDVIVVTGYGSLDSAIKALKIDVYDYILKPFNVTDITNTVRRVFEKHKLLRLNEELKTKLEKNLNDITTLYEISKFISSTADLEKVLTFTAAAIQESIGIEMFSIMLYSKEKEGFKIESAEGLSEKTKENFTFKLNKGIIGNSLNEKDIVFVEDFERDENFIEHFDKKDKKKISSFIIIPLAIGDEIFGLISVHSVKKGNSEDIDKLSLLSIISTQISPLIKLFLYRIEQDILVKDPLFMVRKQMKAILDKAMSYKGGLSFIIFKLYLKKYGEGAYKILDIHQEIFRELHDSISIIDSVIVLGLDSFVVILQGRSQIAAELFAADLKNKIENEINLKETGFLLDHGFANFPIDGETAEELIGKAQNDLWRSTKLV